MWCQFPCMTLSERCDNFIQEALPEAEVYRVGGSVRDELLLRRCRDNDYVVRGMAARRSTAPPRRRCRRRARCACAARGR